MPFGQLTLGSLGLGALGSGGVPPIGNTSTRAPTAFDDITRGNTVGRLWLDTTTDTFYSNTSNTAGAAVWSNLGVVSALPVQASGVAWTAVYGVKSLTSAWLTGNLFDVFRSSDATTQTFAATAGVPDIAAIQSFLSGTVGYVAKWYDQSGNGKDVTVSGSTGLLIRVDHGRISIVGANIIEQGGTGTGGYFTIASSSVNLQASTVVTLIRPFQSMPIPNTSASSTTQAMYAIYNGASAGIIFGQSLSGATAYGQQKLVELSFFTEYAANNIAESDFTVTGYVGSASDQVQFQNEFSTSAGAPNAAATVTATSTIGGGNDGSQYWSINDEVYAFMLAGASALSPSALLAVRKSFYALFDIAPQYINDNYASVGDSITQGYQSATQGHQGWSSTTQIQDLLNRPVRVTNWGVSQATIAYITSKYTTSVQGSVVAGARTNTLRIAIGTNNIDGTAGAGAATWASLASYITTAQADFNHIIVDTLISSGTFDTTPAAEAQRQIYNGLIRSNAAGMGYVVSDVGGSASPLGIPNATVLNPSLFVGDLIHLTAAGQLVVAQYDAAVLNVILGA